MDFFKYHGGGNDFIIFQDFDSLFPKDDIAFIASLCHRRLGIGADGLMLLRSPKHPEAAFDMLYYNADGKEGSLCGNGSRCIVAFAYDMNLVQKQVKFTAADGLHEAEILETTSFQKQICLKMNDVLQYQYFENGIFLDTGSPHFILEVSDLKNYPVYEEGKKWRYHSFFSKGTNVDFVEVGSSEILVRTYERGVEDETLSCGTGVTAAALTYALKHPSENSIYHISLKTRTGDFKVDYNYSKHQFKNIYLTGPTTFVFKGLIHIN